MGKRAGIGLFVLMLVVCGACIKEEPRRNSGKTDVTIHLDWKNPNVPAEMQFRFYPMREGDLFIKDCPAMGFEGELPEDRYRVLIYNTDITGVLFTEMGSYFTATATVQTDAKNQMGEACLVQPSILFACGIDELTTICLERFEMTVTPKRLTRCLELTFSLVNTNEVEALTGVLYGVYSSVTLATGKPTSESMADAPNVCTDFSASVTGNKAIVEVCSLGLLNPEGGKRYDNVLRLALFGKGGWRQETQVDLTDVLTDIFDNNKGELPTEVPVGIDLEIQAVGTKLHTSVKAWSQGEGGGQVYE